MPKKTKTAIICPVWNQLFYTKMFVHSVLTHTSDFKLYIIDNGSDDGTDKFLKKIKKESKDVEVITNKTNTGCVAGWNKGLKKAFGKDYEYFVIINNDIQVTQGWLDRMLEVFKDKDIWVACPDTSVGELPKEFPANPYPDDEADRGKYYTPFKLSGWCFTVKREAFEQRLKEDGYFFDPQFKMMWYEDTDFEVFLQKHKKLIVTVTDSYIHHYESRTVNARSDRDKYIQENKEKFEKKHPYFQRDNKMIVRYKRKLPIEKGIQQINKVTEIKPVRFGKKYKIVAPGNYDKDTEQHIPHGGDIDVDRIPEWAYRKNEKGANYYEIQKL